MQNQPHSVTPFLFKQSYRINVLLVIIVPSRVTEDDGLFQAYLGIDTPLAHEHAVSLSYVTSENDG